VGSHSFVGSAPSDLSSLFKKRAHSNVAPRYKKWFWAAFIKPLESGQRRFILADRWIDIPESGVAPADALPIQRDEIVESQPGTSLDYDIVHKAIDLWASCTSADLKHFHLSSGSVARPAAHAASLSQLASLDVEDMKRIMVPLDVVLKLIKH
jgi:hypothetical protein